MREQPFPEASGFRLLRSGSAAFAARLALIAQAQRSIDIQYYHLAPDTAGLRVVEELRAAARRGVRVRLLVDDLHSFGTDAALLQLSRESNAEVRLFNPFVGLRGPLAARVLASAWDFGRLNARMHNKLLVADGALAVVGGRNLADAYFDAAGGAAYLDLDVLVAGAVISDLGVIFDAYWNDDIVYPIGTITGRAAPPAAGRQGEWPAPEPGPARRPDPAPVASTTRRVLEQPLELYWGWAEAFADAPGKARGAPTIIGGSRVRGSTQMRELIWSEMADARSEYLILTPYLIPGSGGMRTVRANRARGVKISIVTNSRASTDEPLVHSGYRRYRRPMLEAGVELYELSPERGWNLGDELSKERRYGLHTKAVVFDRDTVYLGS
jgi:putative cardiolipin synthase